MLCLQPVKGKDIPVLLLGFAEYVYDCRLLCYTANLLLI